MESQQQQQLPEHFMYQTCNIEQAEAVAWAFLDEKSKPTLYPFIFPPIDDDEIRAKLSYTSICQSDVYYVRKQWYTEQFYPMVVGHECVGEVCQVGNKVKNFKIGDVVGFCTQRSCCGQCEYCKSDHSNLCVKYEQLYDPYFGGYATHIQVKESMTFHIPKNLPLKYAAPMMCAGVTVFSPLKQYAQKGQQVAIIGIGGLGHIAIQMAKAMELKVIAFTSRVSDKLDEIKKLGADEVYSSQDQSILEKLHHQFHLVINTSCAEKSDLFKMYQKLLKNDGTFVQLGIPTKKAELSLDFMDLICGQKKFKGSILGSHKDIEDTLEFAEKHKIYPIIEEFTFDQLPVAFEKQEQNKSHYRNVISVKDWTDKNLPQKK